MEINCIAKVSHMYSKCCKFYWHGYNVDSTLDAESKYIYTFWGMRCLLKCVANNEFTFYQGIKCNESNIRESPTAKYPILLSNFKHFKQVTMLNILNRTKLCNNSVASNCLLASSYAQNLSNASWRQRKLLLTLK